MVIDYKLLNNKKCVYTNNQYNICATTRTNQYNTLPLGVYNKLVLLGYALVLVVIDYNNKNGFGEWCSLVLSQNKTNLCSLSRQKDTLHHEKYACFDYSHILLVTNIIHCRLQTINTNSSYPPLVSSPDPTLSRGEMVW